MAGTVRDLARPHKNKQTRKLSLCGGIVPTQVNRDGWRWGVLSAHSRPGSGITMSEESSASQQELIPSGLTGPAAPPLVCSQAAFF